jgi:hypothetical protein
MHILTLCNQNGTRVSTVKAIWKRVFGYCSRFSLPWARAGFRKFAVKAFSVVPLSQS